MTRATAKNPDRRAAERRGRLAERLAALAYLIRGYEILDRRFKTSGGEADLVVRRGRLIAFVEVKSRNTKDAAVLAVTPRNRLRLEQAAARYLALRPHLGEFAVRYDIAAVAGIRVTLVRDAWRATA